MISIQTAPLLFVGCQLGLRAWAGVYASFFGYYDVKRMLYIRYLSISTSVTALEPRCYLELYNDLRTHIAEYCKAHEEGKRLNLMMPQEATYAWWSNLS